MKSILLPMLALLGPKDFGGYELRENTARFFDGQGATTVARAVAKAEGHTYLDDRACVTDDGTTPGCMVITVDTGGRVMDYRIRARTCGKPGGPPLDAVGCYGGYRVDWSMRKRSSAALFSDGMVLSETNVYRTLSDRGRWTKQLEVHMTVATIDSGSAGREIHNSMSIRDRSGAVLVEESVTSQLLASTGGVQATVQERCAAHRDRAEQIVRLAGSYFRAACGRVSWGSAVTVGSDELQVQIETGGLCQDIEQVLEQTGRAVGASAYADCLAHPDAYFGDPTAEPAPPTVLDEVAGAVEVELAGAVCSASEYWTRDVELCDESGEECCTFDVKVECGSNCSCTASVHLPQTTQVCTDTNPGG